MPGQTPGGRPQSLPESNGEAPFRAATVLLGQTGQWLQSTSLQSLLQPEGLFYIGH